MKLKYLLVVCLFVLGVILVIGNTYAINDNDVNDIENLDLNISLTLEENEVLFNNNIFNYINLVDDSLISTATFNMSDRLNDNYDFLTIFAINFILNNEKYYEDDIIIGNEYIYNDGYTNYSTNKYVSLDVIYDVTNNILGRENYYIVNDYLKIENNLVPLLLIENYNFSMELEKIIEVNRNDNIYEVFVAYKDMDLIYKYIFELVENRLVISNLEVY